MTLTWVDPYGGVVCCRAHPHTAVASNFLAHVDNIIRGRAHLTPEELRDVSIPEAPRGLSVPERLNMVKALDEMQAAFDYVMADLRQYVEIEALEGP